MKPLTIEQLKALEVGDWVWIEDFTKSVNKSVYDCGRYCRKVPTYLEDGFCHGWNGSGGFYFYADYGTKWLAYKNKEQAEAKCEIVEFGIPFFSKHFNAWCVFERVDDYVQTVCITEEQAAHRLAQLKGET